MAKRLFAVSVGVFAWVMLCKRRTLWSGATFLGMMAHLAVTMFCLLADYADYLAVHCLLLGIIIGVYILAMVFILALPLAHKKISQRQQVCLLAYWLVLT